MTIFFGFADVLFQYFFVANGAPCTKCLTTHADCIIPSTKLSCTNCNTGGGRCSSSITLFGIDKDAFIPLVKEYAPVLSGPLGVHRARWLTDAIPALKSLQVKTEPGSKRGGKTVKAATSKVPSFKPAASKPKTRKTVTRPSPSIEDDESSASYSAYSSSSSDPVLQTLLSELREFRGELAPIVAGWPSVMRAVNRGTFAALDDDPDRDADMDDLEESTLK